MSVRKRISGLVLLAAILCACGGSGAPGRSSNLYGTVTSEGKPMAGVWVSDGYSIVRTDRHGRYEMNSPKRQEVLFVITPSGYVAPVPEGELMPRFWQPTSSDSLEVERHDFRLEKVADGPYAAVFLPDAHLCNSKNDLVLFDSLTVTACKKIYRDMAAEGRNVITINLGDISHDRFWYAAGFDLEDAYECLCRCGLHAPMYSTPGNHDHDPAICCTDGDAGDFAAQEKYRKLMGPAWYSLNVGKEHWVFMDNMQYVNTPVADSGIPGVAGKRDYRVCFTPEQLSWLEKDLNIVPVGSQVCFCAHGPLFDNFGEAHPWEQVAFIDSLAASRSLTVAFFAGHVHRRDVAENSGYPSIRVYSLPAVSGNMWESFPQSRPLGLDGCSGGVEYALFGEGPIRHHYVTYDGSNPYFRAYDMNVVRERWRRQPECTWILREVQAYVDYTKPDYRNGILVNDWWFSPGSRVEILEDGHPLAVGPAPFSVDPDGLYSHYNYRRKKYEGRHQDPSDIELAFTHCFYARAASPVSDIIVRVFDEDGILLCEEKLDRAVRGQ